MPELIYAMLSVLCVVMAGVLYRQNRKEKGADYEQDRL